MTDLLQQDYRALQESREAYLRSSTTANLNRYDFNLRSLAEEVERERQKLSDALRRIQSQRAEDVRTHPPTVQRSIVAP
jgi:recombinational DNA repair ATPase RecF